MSEQQQNERKETCLSEPKLRLYGKMLPGADKPPVLIPEIFENNPRFRIRTNLPNDANKGYVDMPFTSPVFAQLAETVRLLARGELTNDQGEKQNGFVLDNFGHPFTQQGRSKEKMMTSKLQVAKDERGIITMTVTAGKNRPLLEFVLQEDDYHHFRDMQGNKMSGQVASKLFTIGWFNSMEKFFVMALRNYVEPAWITKRKAQQAQGGGNSWGGGQQGGGGNNWQQRNQQGGGSYGGQQGGGGNNYAQPQGENVEVDIPF